MTNRKKTPLKMKTNFQQKKL